MARYKVRNHNAFDVKVGALTLLGGREQEIVTSSTKAFDDVEGLHVTLISDEDEKLVEASEDELARARATGGDVGGHQSAKDSRPDGAEGDDDDDDDDDGEHKKGGVAKRVKAAAGKVKDAVTGAASKGGKKAAKPATDDGHNLEKQREMSKPHDTSVTTGSDSGVAPVTDVTEAYDPGGVHKVGGGGGNVGPGHEGEEAKEEGFFSKLTHTLTGDKDKK